jgi:hypothetical protein
MPELPTAEVLAADLAVPAVPIPTTPVQKTRVQWIPSRAYIAGDYQKRGLGCYKGVKRCTDYPSINMKVTCILNLHPYLLKRHMYLGRIFIMTNRLRMGRKNRLILVNNHNNWIGCYKLGHLLRILHTKNTNTNSATETDGH